MKDLSVIPHGMYCHHEAERGRGALCPYFKRLDYPGYPAGEKAARCELTGVEHDVLLDDECKVCDINMDWPDHPEGGDAVK